MRRLSLALIALTLTTSLDARRAAPAPDLGAITLDRRDPTIEATLARMPVRLAVTLDIGLYLSAATAARLPVTWRTGEAEQVGRVRVQHREAAGRMLVSGIALPVLMQTQDEPCCDGHDGALSAAGLPWSTVRFGEAGSAPERRFPLARDQQSGLSVPWVIGGRTIHVVLAPTAAETVATASAAAILAQAYGGHLQDAARETVVAYGVARTVREMTFDRPIDPLGLPVDRIAVRIGDFAGDTSLPEPPAAPAGADEIDVRHRPLPPQYRWPAITIGRDLLGRCAAISFYRGGAGGAPAIGLSCGG